MSNSNTSSNNANPSATPVQAHANAGVTKPVTVVRSGQVATPQQATNIGNNCKGNTNNSGALTDEEHARLANLKW